MRKPARLGLALAAVSAAFIVAAAPAAAKTATKSFSQCVAGGALTDHVATSAAINVPVPKNGKKIQSGVVTGVTAGVRVSHTANGDLAMLLVNPAGRVINLTDSGSGNGFGTGPGCGGAPAVFSDAGALTVSDSPAPGSNPYTGTFRPQQPLASFIGGPARGVWSLIVLDETDADVGALDGATLNVTYTYNKAKKKKGKKK
jgi:subtilisin-like proprotein convertase family protein